MISSGPGVIWPMATPLLNSTGVNHLFWTTRSCCRAEIIAEIEPSRRGLYCGTIGYLSATGALDTSIVIRTYLALGNRVYFSVGGGIVADSDPEDEYRETLHKARALIATLDHAADGADALQNA
jgi:hypothetical protein